MLSLTNLYSTFSSSGTEGGGGASNASSNPPPGKIHTRPWCIMAGTAVPSALSMFLLLFMSNIFEFKCLVVRRCST